MDTLLHALWGFAITNRKANFWLAGFFGALPDLFSFTIPIILGIFYGGQFWTSDSEYIRILYNISHSLVVCIFVFLIVYAFKRKVYLFMLGWPFHILIDIPTHEKGFYATEFLYPISNFSFDGIRWSNPYIFFGNWILLLVFYAYLFRKEIKYEFKKIKF